MHILCQLNLSGKGMTLCEQIINNIFPDIKSKEDKEEALILTF